MEQYHQFIQDIALDDKKRIVITVQKNLEDFLKSAKVKHYLLKAVKTTLKDDFKHLEIGNNMVRITVKTGTEDINLQKIRTELLKGLETIYAFLFQ